jgi:hypothetical protein
MKKPIIIKKSVGSVAAKISKPRPVVRRPRLSGRSITSTLPSGSKAKTTAVKVTSSDSVTTLKKRVRKPLVSGRKKPISGNVVVVKKENVSPTGKVTSPVLIETIKSGPANKTKQKDSAKLKSKKQKSGKNKRKEEKKSAKKKFEKTEKKARELKKEMKRTKKKKGQKKKLKSIKKKFAKVLKHLKLNRKKLKTAKK